MVGANRQLLKMIRHPAFRHSFQSQRWSCQEYAMMVQQAMVFFAVFQKFTPVWCFSFSWFLKDSNNFFFIHCPKRHHAVTQAICENDGGRGTSDLKLDAIFKHIFCVIWVSIPNASTFPGFLWWFHFDSPSSPRHRRQDALGLWKNTRKSLSEFVEVVGRCGRGRTKSKSFFLTPDFYVAPWLSWNSLIYFGGMAAFFEGFKRAWFGLNVCVKWCWKMMDFFWWHVGKLLQVNETTSLTLGCRAFSVRFSIRESTSTSKNDLLFMFKSSWSGNS